MESSECLLTSNLNDFLLKLSNFTWNPQMQVNFFLQMIFYKNRIFTKTIFLLNHTSWGYFLDYMNLPYQFGILRMCTFCWFDWFLSKPSIILVIHTNTCALFFSSDLRSNVGMWKNTYEQFKFEFYSIQILNSRVNLKSKTFYPWESNQTKILGCLAQGIVRLLSKLIYLSGLKFEKMFNF